MKLNQFYAIGYLVRDAEIKTMPNGKNKQVFTLAVNDDYKKAGSDEWIKRVYFVDCYVVGKEYQNLTKGKKVFVNGKMVTRNYEVQGAKKKITLVEVFALDFMKQIENGNDELVPVKTKNEDISSMEVEDLPF